MPSDTIQAIIEDATFDFTIGENASAIAKLQTALESEPESFAAWHALAEIQFSERHFDEALQAAEKAHSINPDDVFINTSLSRIWMEKGDKSEAEKFGAKAKILGWKDQLENPSEIDENLA